LRDGWFCAPKLGDVNLIGCQPWPKAGLAPARAAARIIERTSHFEASKRVPAMINLLDSNRGGSSASISAARLMGDDFVS